MSNLREILVDLLQWCNGFSQRKDIDEKHADDYMRFRQLNPATPATPSMQWVKAEILPTKRHNYHVKMRSFKGSGYDYLFNTTCLFDGVKFVDDINVRQLASGNTVEFWLSENPAPIPVKEDVSGTTGTGANSVNNSWGRWDGIL